MKRFVDSACRLIEIAIAIALGIMVLMVFGNVVLRYAFNSGLIISEELSRWLFLWVIFLGAAVAVKERSHLGSDVLVSRLPVWGQRVCLAISQLVMLYVTWLIFSGALAQTRINWSVTAPVSGASMAFVYGTGVVFALLAAAMLLRELWGTVTGQPIESGRTMFKETEESAESISVRDRDVSNGQSNPPPTSRP